jgi:hypothetical protein
MTQLIYKLEYVFDDSTAADESVFIHIRDNPPIYQSRITKESYDILPEEEKNEFLTQIFNMAGVTELSSKAYRLWVMKSPVYNWKEVMDPSIDYLRTFFGHTDTQSLPGSANTDGTGFKLDSINNRRKV